MACGSRGLLWLIVLLLGQRVNTLLRVPLQRRLATRRLASGDAPRAAGDGVVHLTNLENMQFFGEIGVGTPPQPVTVVFDTGSGSFVVAGSDCQAVASGGGEPAGAAAITATTSGAAGCQGAVGDTGYDPGASSTVHAANPKTFSTSYGSGVVEGDRVRDTLTVAGFAAPNVLVGVAHRESPIFSDFMFDGIFGLDMTVEDGQRTDVFSRLIEANPSMLPMFSVYLTPPPGLGSQNLAQGSQQGGVNDPNQGTEGSELVIGGVDNSKAAPGAAWMWAPALRFPVENDGYNYWAVQMPYFELVHASKSEGRGDASSGARARAVEVEAQRRRLEATNECGSGGGCTAIIDSGTTFIAIASAQYRPLMQKITSRLPSGSCQFDDSGVEVMTCGGAKLADFPSLRFGFGSGGAAFELVPAEYVDCETVAGTCSPSLRKHTASPGVPTDYWIFGDVFMRKYYTTFDHGGAGPQPAKRLGFICARGMCRADGSSTASFVEESVFAPTFIVPQGHAVALVVSAGSMLLISLVVLALLVHLRRRRRNSSLRSGQDRNEYAYHTFANAGGRNSGMMGDGDQDAARERVWADL